MTEEQLQTICALRRTLHEHPELSMHETETAELLKRFLHTHTSCEIIDCGSWFYAVRYADSADADTPTIAFRCDMDAIPHAGTGKPFHGCGHDGHAAAVAGLAYLTEGMQLDKNLVFLFQPGEETGEGAILCRDVIDAQHITEIYGCHSIPGYPAGEILFREDVFACASRGMILRFTGRQCHAAYPETGNNPAFAAARVVDALHACVSDRRYRGMVLATVVELKIGSRAFGVSAGEGELCLTVRAHYDEDLDALIGEIRRTAEDACRADGITLDVSFIDVFPDTKNDTEAANRFYALLERKGIPVRKLPEPMRWSEDFGWYCKKTRGIFFGVGAGEDAPALHTGAFCYNDALLPRVEEVFLAIINA